MVDLNFVVGTDRLSRSVGKKLSLIELLVREEAKVNANCCSKLPFGEALQGNLSLLFARANFIWTKLQVASANTKLFTCAVEEISVTNNWVKHRSYQICETPVSRHSACKLRYWLVDPRSWLTWWISTGKSEIDVCLENQTHKRNKPDFSGESKTQPLIQKNIFAAHRHRQFSTRKNWRWKEDQPRSSRGHNQRV
jgi:hypothetical protein